MVFVTPQLILFVGVAGPCERISHQSTYSCNKTKLGYGFCAKDVARAEESNSSAVRKFGVDAKLVRKSSEGYKYHPRIEACPHLAFDRVCTTCTVWLNVN